MGQRSPYNERYKTENKGKTRKSASSAKPKREVADLTPTGSSKKAEKKKGLFARSRTAPRAVQPIPSSPRMKQLRRIWWVLWIVALLVAVGILYLERGGAAYQGYVAFAWGVWAFAMAGAFYLEFVPIRKERARLMAGAGSGGKSSASATGKPESIQKPDATKGPDEPGTDTRG